MAQAFARTLSHQLTLPAGCEGGSGPHPGCSSGPLQLPPAPASAEES